LPNYDKDRVYVSDMKKVLTWYNILHALKMLNFEEKAKEQAEDTSKTTDAKPKKINRNR